VQRVPAACRRPESETDEPTLYTAFDVDTYARGVPDLVRTVPLIAPPNFMRPSMPDFVVPALTRMIAALGGWKNSATSMCYRATFRSSVPAAGASRVLGTSCYTLPGWRGDQSVSTASWQVQPNFPRID
jgi:hypothetical protein